MLRLIEQLLPRGLHRLALRIAHRARHRWRVLRRVPLSGVSIVATDDAGRVLLVRHSYGPPVWALPGGGAKRGETPEATAQRELQEELGTRGRNPRLIGSFDEVLSGSPHTAQVVQVLVEFERVTPDRREIAEARMCALDALPGDLGRLAAARIRFWQSQQR
ncbi:NUDIX domain-containing protein [Altererythrobacter sp. CAU 1778]